MTTQSSFRQQSTPPRWENINRTTGFVPPPRFQQLRNQQRQHQQQEQQNYQQQQSQQQQQNYRQQQFQQQPQPQLQAQQQPHHHNQLQFPSIQPAPMAPIASQSPQPRPPLQNHGTSRSSTFFSFRSNKQSLESQSTPPVLNGKSKAPQQPGPQKLQRPPPTQIQPQGPPPPQQNLPPSQPPYANMQQQKQEPPAAQSTVVVRQPSMQGKAPASPAAPPPPLHPEIRSVVQLTVAHAHKVYFSGPLVRRIERQPDGHRPAKDDGWTDVWAQLGGTTLSIWDMKEIQEASKQGKEVPPTYVNVTDAFVQVLGSVTVPGTADAPAKRYTNVLTVNTAGSNLLLFSCPSTQALISWAAALRLSAWEKSRLEEIYTAHLIRITLSTRDSPSTLIRGRMEGWVRIRISGQTDWKRLWVVVTAGTETSSHPTDPSTPSTGIGAVPSPPLAAPKKNRMSSLFSREHTAAALPAKPTIAMYLSPKPKDKKRPLLTLREVTQVFAVYPERPELISRSTLIKVEGLLGDEEMAATMKGREGWLLIMPELEGGAGQAAEMLKWVVGLHDAFELYGRPEAWTWDPRDPVSLMFAYPVGPYKDLLFLERDPVEALDPRDDRTSAIRSRLLSLLLERIRANEQRPAVQGVPSRTSTSDAPPSLPPIGGAQQNGFASSSSSSSPSPPSTSGPQLPPLSFSSGPVETVKVPLTPITERSSIHTQGRTVSMDAPSMLSPAQSSLYGTAPPSVEKPEPPLPNPSQATTTLFDKPLSHSPAPGSVASGNQSPTLQQQQQQPGRPSFDNGGRSSFDNAARPSFDNAPRPSFDNNANRNAGTQPPFTVRSLSPIKQGGSSPDLTNRANSLSPANIQLPLSPAPTSQTPPSFAQPPPAFAQAPPSFATSRPSIDRTNSSPTPNSYSQSTAPPDTEHLQSPTFLNHHNNNRQGSGDFRTGSPSISILTSPHSIREETGMKTHDTFFSDRSSLLTSPHSPERRMQQLGVPSDAASILTSPHSPTEEERRTPQLAGRDRNPALTPPYSAEAERRAQAGGGAISPQMLSNTAPISRTAVAAPQAEDSGDFFNEAGALYFMQQSEGGAGNRPPARPLPSVSHPTMSPDADSDSSDGYGSTKPSIPPAASSQNAGSSSPEVDYNSSSSRSPPARRSTPMAFVDRASHAPAPSARSGLGRKPSGARAPASSRPYNGGSISSHQQLTEEEELHSDNDSNMNVKRDLVETPRNQEAHEEPMEHPDADVLAALSYLDVEDSQAAESSTSSNANVQPLNLHSNASSPPPKSPLAASEQGPQQFKSSFAPSKQAAERKAKVQAQQAAHHAAVHKPGRANGNRKSRIAGAWGESTDEEEEEEEEEEEDADSDAETPLTRGQNTPSSGLASSNASMRMPQERGQGVDPQGAYSNARPSRTLPQIPGNRPLLDDHPPPPRRLASDQYSEARRTHYDEGPQIRSQAEMPKLGAGRQSIWSQVLDPRAPGAPAPNQASSRDKFIQLDPSEAMTKAFTPQGLLSASLQDKDDRSAKRQEELARETGASLINVPHKPQPPQTGLLGAITAHERERKREGGVGAALTEREREKRVAEERQRRFDEQQRQQMEQMQQTGSMYGAPYPNFNPMMGNPMMMGMNPMMLNPMMTGGGMSPMMSGGGMAPMMSGGGMNSGGMAPMMSGGGMAPMMTGQMGQMGQMGYPGMMPGFNPQHMFAAQQAAQAYQQAMMAFSVAGSQVGGDPGGAPSQLNPNMTGGTMGPMDPRMSMMGMPMMGGNQMGGQMPLGMQMTGMSGFDARFSPNITPNMGNSPAGQNNSALLPPMGANNQNQAPFSSSRNSSPAGRGSPLARPGADQPENRTSRPATPKH